jgi:glucoamylase
MPVASIVLYTRDGWKSQAEVATKDTGLGLHVAEISTQGMEPGGTVEFTWRVQADGHWRGRNFDVGIDASRSSE